MSNKYLKVLWCYLTVCLNVVITDLKCEIGLCCRSRRFRLPYHNFHDSIYQLKQLLTQRVEPWAGPNNYDCSDW